MAITVKHSKVSTIPDGDDSSVVRPSDWNDDHVLTGTIPVDNGGTGASTLTGYVKGNGTSAMTASTTIPNTDITGLGTASTKDAGSALGVATLDASGKVPVSELPSAVLGALSYQGTWNASTNTPTLTSSVGTKGYYYVVSVGGSTDLDGITDWVVGDWAVFNGTVWQQIDNTDAVTSVNGQVGTVVLTTTNIAEGTNEYFTTARARASVSAGTAISYDNSTGVITNSAPDQTVALTGGTGISTSGTYPNFTITNTAPSSGGTVTSVGGTGTVSGISLSGTVTSSGNLTLGGSLNLSAPPAIGGTTPNAVTGTTVTAATGFVSENYLGLPGLGGNLKTNGGTSLLNWDGGGSGNVTVNGGLNANPSNKNVSIAPTGTGTATINPATAGTMNNMVIGGTTPLAITGTTITATSFVGSGASLTGVVTSVTGTAPVVSSGGTTPAISMAAATGSVNGYLTSTDWTTFNSKGSGTVTSVGGTGTVNGLTLSGTVTSSGNLTLGGTLDLSSPPAIGGTAPNAVAGTVIQATNGIVVNSNTVSASYTIPTGSSAMSAGPMTVASGQTVTVSSGSRWVVL
jgi:hypothetical protein